MKQEEIELKAEATLVQYDALKIPVDPVVIANKIGIRVSNALFSDESLSGIISKRGHNVSILVNQGDHPFRKRFTIAHELGHHFLHLANIENTDIVETVDLFRATLPANGNTSSQMNEIQANQFAAALLMPRSLIKEAFKTLAKEVSALARAFNVSEEAMSYRLKGLNLV